MQTCAHCHKRIGQLEPVYAWNEQVICADCQRTLGAAASQPTAAPITVVVERPRVQLIERTAKFWKAQVVLALLLMLLGLGMTGVGVYLMLYPPIAHGSLALGGVVLCVGFIWLLIARAGAWWEHG